MNSTTASPALQSALDALAELRAGLARMLEEQPLVRRAADVEQLLGLDRPLAWRLFRTATASDAAETFQHLPSQKQLLRIVDVARKKGVQSATLDAIVAQIDRFELEMHAIADDRTAFSALLCGHDAQGPGALELKVRKEAYRSNSHLWGTNCRTLLFGAVFHHVETQGAMDAIAARAWIDVYTSSPRAAPLLLSRFRATHQGETEPKGGTKVGQMEIVPGFGASPDIQPATAAGEDGFQETFIRLQGIGRQSRTSLFARMHIAAANMLDARAGIAHTPCIPTEVLHFDLLVPAGWSDASTMSALAHARPYDVHRAAERRDIDRISCHEKPVCIPGIENVPPSPDAPHWPDVMRHLLKERGWWGKRFDLYRLRIEYPLLHASFTLEVRPKPVSSHPAR